MKTRRQERGMALLLVLVVVALLTSVLTDLAFSTLVDMRLTETFRDSTKAYYLAKGGVNAGRMILQIDKNGYDSLREPWSKGIYSYPVGQGNVSIQIEDQDGKLAVNNLVSGNNPQTVMVDRFYRFLVAMDVEEAAELTANLVDWLDSGDSPYAEIRTDGLDIPVAGAEDRYYQTLTPAYHCKNGALETLEELTLVKGFTPELVKNLRPHLTVNETQSLNVNTASPEVLMSLDLKIDRDTAQNILDYRQGKSIERITELETELDPDMYAVLKTLANLGQLSTASRYYRIEALALVNDGRRQLLAQIDKDNNKLLFFKVN